VNYYYDNIGQLKVAASSLSTENRGYTYDAAWNLNRRTNNGATSAFVVDTKDELTNAPSPVGTAIYDLNGNMCTNQSGNRVYVYDAENQLSEYYRFNLGGIHPNRLTTFYYDGLSRLRIRIESHWEDSGGTEKGVSHN